VRTLAFTRGAEGLLDAQRARHFVQQVDSPEGRPLFQDDGGLHGLECREIFFVAQGQSDRLDLLGGARAEVRDRAMFHLAVFTEGFAQQEAGVGFGALPNGRDIDVHSGYLYST
jgi:hypothetical protein